MLPLHCHMGGLSDYHVIALAASLTISDVGYPLQLLGSDTWKHQKRQEAPPCQSIPPGYVFGALSSRRAVARQLWSSKLS